MVPPGAHKTNSPQAALATASPNPLRARVNLQGGRHVRRHRVDFIRTCHSGPEGPIYGTLRGGCAKALVCAAAVADYQFRTQRCNLDTRCCLHVCYRPFARDEHTDADLRTRRNQRAETSPHQGSAAECWPRVPDRHFRHSVPRPPARFTIRRSCKVHSAREKEITPCRRTAR